MTMPAPTPLLTIPPPTTPLTTLKNHCGRRCQHQRGRRQRQNYRRHRLLILRPRVTHPTKHFSLILFENQKNAPVVVIDGHENIPANDEDSLLKAVAHQPVSVAIEASGLDFQFYSEGVFTGSCGTELDHGVAVVGYGKTQHGTKYWIVRNSWGAEWGERGYIRMLRGTKHQEGLCGIAMEASYPIKSSPNPTHIPKDEL